MDWEACERNRLAKKVSPDKNLANSLSDSSALKFQTQALLELTDITATSKISLVYDALRELLEAIAITKGYKIYNHECYCAFLKEILKDSELGDLFDSFRKVRNLINYYGKKVSAEEAKPIINELVTLLEKIQEKFQPKQPL